LEDPALGGEGVDAAVVVASESSSGYLELNMFDMGWDFKNYLNIVAGFVRRE